MDDRKTVTRRVVKPQPEMVFDGESLPDGSAYGGWEPKLPPWSKWPYQTGMNLWVRETWQAHDVIYDDYCGGYEAGYPLKQIPNKKPSNVSVSYAEDGEDGPWRPSIHMPRWASRITLEITDARVERLHEITEEDARAEGIIDGGCLNCGKSEPCGCPNPQPDARDTFVYLWDSIYGKKYPWKSNPWVWVIEFRRVR